MKCDVSIDYRKGVKYPSGEYYYSPSELYPEYPLGAETLSAEKNEVYGMVRNALHMMGLDDEHYGTKEWNPFGGIIEKGNTVLVKPNWVMHFNPALSNPENLDCLVTHPSVVRVVIDYVHIALNNTGKIYVADAPMQECNINEMFARAGYNRLFEFWDEQKLEVEVRDLRHYASNIEDNVLTDIQINDKNEAVCVDMGIQSVHEDNNNKLNNYKVSQYLIEDTQNHHSNGKHEYVLNKIVLDADVIINVPKPKCHRLAGMTAAMKNMVGTIYDKNCLPHRRVGSPKEGGDAYAKSSIFKRIMESADEKKTKESFLKHYKSAKIFSVAEKITYVLGWLTTGDKSRVGGWYGNDTIWRTIIDLNNIVNYCDKNGRIQEGKQRKTFVIGDMIICGEKNGPVKPISKNLGMIMVSTDFAIFDLAMSMIMGFKWDSIPYIKYMLDHSSMSLKNIKISSNLEELNNVLSGIRVKDEWRFEPHEQWKGHI